MKLIKPLAFFDVESTGPDTAIDRIIQIAILKIPIDYPKTEPTRWKQFVNPGIPIPAKSTEIHGITDDMLGMCPNFQDVSMEMLGHFHGHDLAGYNILQFDIPMIMEELGRIGREWDLQTTQTKILDAYPIFKHLMPHSLEQAHRQFVGGDVPNAHDADADNLATFDVWKGMMARVPTIGDTVDKWESLYLDRSTMVDLAGKFVHSETPGTSIGDNEIVFNFGLHKGRNVQFERSYLQWMIDNKFPYETKQWCHKFLNH